MINGYKKACSLEQAFFIFTIHYSLFTSEAPIVHYSLFTSEAPIVCPLRGASAATSMQTSAPLQ